MVMAVLERQRETALLGILGGPYATLRAARMSPAGSLARV